jgi:S-adenosylmethionine-diacylglycerol 3-amino-3-carboxypropyl transferase
MYRDALRPRLSAPARDYWDRHISFFKGRGWRKSFYYRGTSGLLARVVLGNMHVLHRLHRPIQQMLEARTIDEQREIYHTQVRDRIWTPWLLWFLSRSTTLSLVGVPWPQHHQLVTQYPGGVPRFVRDALEAVLTELPFRDNYFWRVYLDGSYTPDCCPEYLRPDNFQRLKTGLLDRLRIYTGTITEFLRQAEPGLSKFVLLDHMDWMSFKNPQALVDEWNLLLQKARPGIRAIFRSAGLKVSYLDHLRVRLRGQEMELGQLLRYHPALAAKLHARDRVHTYGSFYIADLPDEVGG